MIYLNDYNFQFYANNCIYTKLRRMLTHAPFNMPVDKTHHIQCRENYIKITIYIAIDFRPYQ